jgi:hypothetical protein
VETKRKRVGRIRPVLHLEASGRAKRFTLSLMQSQNQFFGTGFFGLTFCNYGAKIQIRSV